MKIIDKHFVDGAWHQSTTNNEIILKNPANKTPYATVKLANVSLTNKAVLAAKRAFTEWQHLGFSERSSYITRIVEQLKARRSSLIDAIVEELGCPVSFVEMVQVDDPISAFEDHIQYAKTLAQYYDKTEQVIDGSLSVRKEAIGVCALITPWNYPLHQLVAKVAPALVAGCTVVVKPSELTPQTAILLAQAVEAANLPKGVFNLLIGAGDDVGNALISHDDVDCVSFTGSTAVGKLIQRVSANNLKRVCLELGGKSAFIISPTVNLSKAVQLGVEDVMCNSGQTCVALTRMLVQQAQYEKACEIAATHAKSLKVASPNLADTFLGPVINQSQFNKVHEYIALGLAEGATLIAGGDSPKVEAEGGYYINPTVFSNVSNNMRIAQEEIFGPVLCIIPYENEIDAINIANDSIYGLAARVWSDDTIKAKEIARKIRAGLVFINDAQWHNAAPFGGYKQSGNGRELGLEGINEFLEIKSIVNG